MLESKGTVGIANESITISYVNVRSCQLVEESVSDSRWYWFCSSSLPW